MTPTLPYKLAVLCYLYDENSHVLLLHRRQAPNAGMYSPIGGKLEMTRGEGPHECALREIHEEAGLRVPPQDIRLTGIVTERAYEGETHWLLFLFELMRPVRHDEIRAMDINEGRLEWVEIERVHELPIPETDRRFMWPLVKRHRSGFFMVHIDCTRDDFVWTVTETTAQPIETIPSRCIRTSG